jgi:DNA-binding GntR family transcriptional regulator
MENEVVRTELQTPLTELAFRRLRHDVLSGTYPAGSKLKLEDLQGHYGFSSSPLREALSRLSQEGLVRADERRGFRVASLSADDLADITRMRLKLDLDAMAESLETGDDEWEAQVVAAFHRLEKIEGKLGDGPVYLSDEWTELHRAFHMILLSAARSERLKSWSASLFDQAERYRRASAQLRQTPRRKSNEHRKIMEAALRRDKETACALLAEHIKSTERNVLTALRTAQRAGH